MCNPGRQFRIWSLYTKPVLDPCAVPYGVEHMKELRTTPIKETARVVNTVLPTDAANWDPLYNGRPTTKAYYNREMIEIVDGEVVEWREDAKIVEHRWEYVLDGMGLTSQVIRKILYYRNDGTVEDGYDEEGRPLFKDIGVVLTDESDRIHQGVLRRQNCVDQMKGDVIGALLIHHVKIPMSQAQSPTMTPTEVGYVATALAQQFGSELRDFIDNNLLNLATMRSPCAEALEAYFLSQDAPAWLQTPMYDRAAANPMVAPIADMTIADFIVQTIDTQAVS
jgi:hypothetical protein